MYSRSHKCLSCHHVKTSGCPSAPSDHRLTALGLLGFVIAGAVPTISAALPAALPQDAFTWTIGDAEYHGPLAHRGLHAYGPHMSDLSTHDLGVMSLVDMGMHLSGEAGALLTGTGSARHLLHGGKHVRHLLPGCPRCVLYVRTGNWVHGHCRKRGRFFNCRVRSDITEVRRFRRGIIRRGRVINELPQTPVPEDSGSADTDPVFASGAGGTAFPETTMRTLGPIDPQHLDATAPFVACLLNSDCALPPANFAALDGAPPVNVGDSIAGVCQRPEFVDDPSGVFFDFPGICVCTYVDPGAPPTVVERALAATTRAAGTFPIQPAGRTLEEVEAGDEAYELEYEGLPGYDVSTGQPLSDFARRGFCLQTTQAGSPGLPFPVHPFFVPTDDPIIFERFECRPLPLDRPRPPIVEFTPGTILNFTEGVIVSGSFVDYDGVPVPMYMDEFEEGDVDFYDCSYDPGVPRDRITAVS